MSLSQHSTPHAFCLNFERKLPLMTRAPSVCPLLMLLCYFMSMQRLYCIDVSNVASPSVAGFITDTTDGTTGWVNRLGYPVDVAVVGNRAFVVSDYYDRLTIVSVEDPTAMTILGSIADTTRLNGAMAIRANANFAYIAAAYNNAIAIVDVSTSSSPAVVGDVVSSTDLYRPYALSGPSGSNLYVANYYGSKATIVDVGNASSPTVLESASSSYLSGEQGKTPWTPSN